MRSKTLTPPFTELAVTMNRPVGSGSMPLRLTRPVGFCSRGLREHFLAEKWKLAIVSPSKIFDNETKLLFDKKNETYHAQKVRL